jgi:fatty-acyl-CoA synthase
MCGGPRPGSVERMTHQALTTSYWPADTSSPVLETTVGGVLRTAAAQAPDRIALISGDPDPARRRQWTYRELLTGAERAARALRARFAPGEPVAVWAGNCPEWVLLEFAAALAGLTLVTANPAYQADELAHVLGHSRARGLFLAAGHRGASLPGILAGVRGQLPDLREVIPFGEWDRFCASGDGGPLPVADPAGAAQVLYTSGTTGRPKAAVLTHRGLTNNARLAASAIGMRDGDTFVQPMPLFHIAGCGLLTLGLVQARGTHVLMPHFDPALVFELTETYRSVAVGGVATMLTALLGHPARTRHDLSSVRYALSGGAMVPAELARQVEQTFGVPLVITFAQTESSCSITATRAADSPADRAETVGRPLPQTEVKITDPRTGEMVPCGAVGEICTRGYLVMQGYLGDPDATSAAVDDDGWLHTGDLGSMDERGYCRIQGRIKEMIIRGGENIYPREIENVLLSHPGVADAAVVGVPDRFWGEEVGAVIRPAGPQPPTAAELTGLCRARLAAYKVPARWLFTDSFPLTSTGKFRKDVLSAQLAAAQPPPAPPLAATEPPPAPELAAANTQAVPHPGKLLLQTSGACDFDPAHLLDVFAAQRQRFVTVLQGFGPDDWSAPTRCADWSAHHVVRHLADCTAIMLASGPGDGTLDPAERFDPRTTPRGWLAASDGEPPGASLDRLVATTGKLLSAVRDRLRHGRRFDVRLPFGPMDWTVRLLHLFWDSWVHERDVLLPQGADYLADGDATAYAAGYGVFIAAAVAPMLGDPVRATLRLGGDGGGTFDVGGRDSVTLTVDRAATAGPSAAEVADALAGRSPAAVFSDVPAGLFRMAEFFNTPAEPRPA